MRSCEEILLAVDMEKKGSLYFWEFLEAVTWPALRGGGLRLTCAGLISGHFRTQPLQQQRHLSDWTAPCLPFRFELSWMSALDALHVVQSFSGLKGHHLGASLLEPSSLSRNVHLCELLWAPKIKTSA